MVLGVPPRPGRLRHASSLELRIGGAESNVAIALSRLGLSAGWISLLGDDEPGQLVLDRVRAEGVDTSLVSRLPGRSTGLYLREYVAGAARAYYYRRGSAASAMSPGLFDPTRLEGASFMHLTGITPALSEDCLRFNLWAAKEANTRGVRLSFDVNYRSKLWPPEQARAFVEEILPLVDLLFVGDDEARALWGSDDVGLLRRLHDHGPAEVVLKRGDRGSMFFDGELILKHPGFDVDEVDPIGAGDAFAAGYLAGHLWGLPAEERLRLGNAMGALCVSTVGDYEGLPDRKELETFLRGIRMPGR
ncbi:2-dehydro-3-deoxygluconokinase [Rubrobacter xylanophilus]|uniref:2-dehydro-3-deoxygluconokinase n=2 Tax=Rubrobacter xylanophilus TaxID=49319 RepID=A0A510HIM6_9ACTN|nr:2-dehydro-3-deoxygluconokinase [Rubrobacter xylanophilus]